MGKYRFDYNNVDDYLVEVLEYIFDNIEDGAYGLTLEEALENIDEVLLSGAKKWLKEKDFLGILVFLAEDDDFMPLALSLLERYIQNNKEYYRDMLERWYENQEDDDYFDDEEY